MFDQQSPTQNLADLPRGVAKRGHPLHRPVKRAVNSELPLVESTPSSCLEGPGVDITRHERKLVGLTSDTCREERQGDQAPVNIAGNHLGPAICLWVEK